MTGTKDDRTLASASAPGVARVVSEAIPSPLLESQPRSQRVGRQDPSRLAFGENARFAERELIEVGGMGTVVRAFDKDLCRDVAIKVLSQDLLPGEEQVTSFTREARITGQLEHPYIVPVHEFGSVELGVPFFCMKLVQGQTLESALASAGPLRLEPDRLADLLEVLVKVCDAVSFAHSRAIMHRDLKPSNVMISDFGQVYVLDWGLACPIPRLVRERATTLDAGAAGSFEGFAGTMPYAAPEQWLGKRNELDERTDVFALGATLYEILTGEPPRSERLILREPITPPEELVPGAKIPAELSRIALKAMAYAPADRYQSVADFKHDLERFQRSSWHLPRRRFAAGAVIVSQAEPGEEAYIIVSGRCAVFRTDDGVESVLRELGSGEVFGETAVFSKKPRTASVRALDEVEVMVVTSDNLSNALGLNFWMGAFVKALADRFRDVDERLRQFEQEERRQSSPPPRDRG